MLRTALGPAIATWLDDPSVVEVMLNPDGQLWIDRLTTGLAETGEHLTAADGERIVRLVAEHAGAARNNFSLEGMNRHEDPVCVTALRPWTGVD